MVLFETSDEWQRQSSLLLQARPTTARITVKYNLPNLQSPKYQKARKRKRGSEDDEKDAGATPVAPKAMLVLKTFDPESGVCLKFKTDRAAEVGRLINGLGRLGRHMAALPQKTEDAVMVDAGEADSQVVGDVSASNATEGKQPATGGAGAGGAAGGKKKKKGKK